MELHADRLPRSWGNRTAAFSHFFGEMAKQQYRVANHEVNFRKVDWYQQFKTVRCPQFISFVWRFLPRETNRHCSRQSRQDINYVRSSTRDTTPDIVVERQPCCSALHLVANGLEQILMRHVYCRPLGCLVTASWHRRRMFVRAQPVPIPSMAEYTFVKVNSRGQVITGPDLL